MRTILVSTFGVVSLALIAASAVGTTAQSPGAPSAPPAVPTVGTSEPTGVPVSDVTLERLIAPNAEPELYATGLAGAEGPLWLPDGRLIVSELDANVVSVFDAAGDKSDFRRPSNYANGHTFDLDGSVLQAEYGDATTPGRITRLAVTGPDIVLADSFQGKRFSSPNDLVVKSDGTIWFTVADYGSMGNDDAVYRLDPRTGAVTLLTETWCNGIAFSPDEKTLYVSDTDTHGVSAFPVNDDGTIGPGEAFGRGCDGIAVDEQGNVWATCWSAPEIYVTDPEGIEIGTVTFPGATANVAWGGDDGRTLFVTTRSGVYRLQLTVREAR